MVVGVELKLELEVELGLSAATPMDVAEAVFHKLFIKPVRNSSVHKWVHKMTAVSVF